MTSEAMSPLRRRIIEDKTVRKFVEKTQKDYIRYVKDLTAFLGRSPDTATAEDLRRYQLHLTNSGVHPPRINATVSALRFFFSVTLDRAEVSRLLTFVAHPRKIPIVLSPEEVVRFLEAAPGPKYKAALSAAYGAGLRVSEVVALKVSDVDSERMLLRIEQGKGSKDRFAMLSPQLLELLRDWWRIERPRGWLFPGQNPVNHLTTRQLNRVVHATAHAAEITKRVTPHTLRHYVSFRTMSGIRKGLQISSEISDQVARGFCQLSNIVLPAYGRAIARSVECWGYRCLRNDFRNRPMCAGHKAFCNRSRAICSSTVHRSWLVAPCRLDRRSQNYVACDRRNLPGKPDQNREYPT